jgi:hypothetical protein
LLPLDVKMAGPSALDTDRVAGLGIFPHDRPTQLTALTVAAFGWLVFEIFFSMAHFTTAPAITERTSPTMKIKVMKPVIVRVSLGRRICTTSHDWPDRSTAIVQRSENLVMSAALRRVSVC